MTRRGLSTQKCAPALSLRLVRARREARDLPRKTRHAPRGRENGACRQYLALGRLQTPRRSLNQSPEPHRPPPPPEIRLGLPCAASAPASPNTHGVLAAGGAAQFLRPAARRLRPVAAPPQLSRPSRPPPRSRSGASSRAARPAAPPASPSALSPAPALRPAPLRRRAPSVLSPLPPAPLAARQQDAADKEDAGRQAQAEPPHPAVDPHAHGQPDPVQREAPALAPHEDRPLDYSLRERS